VSTLAPACNHLVTAQNAKFSEQHPKRDELLDHDGAEARPRLSGRAACANALSISVKRAERNKKVHVCSRQEDAIEGAPILTVNSGG
jgi:hypothetical protein